MEKIKIKVDFRVVKYIKMNQNNKMQMQVAALIILVKIGENKILEEGEVMVSNYLKMIHLTQILMQIITIKEEMKVALVYIIILKRNKNNQGLEVEEQETISIKTMIISLISNSMILHLKTMINLNQNNNKINHNIKPNFNQALIILE